MSINFGVKENLDELASIATFKEVMKDLQKQNVQLETERIDLQVRVAKLREECDEMRVEKEYMSKRAQKLSESNQKLQREIDTVRAELDRTKTDLEKVNIEYVNLRKAYSNLLETNAEHEQLKVTHTELSQHYERLYNQANDIVSGNQLLNEQNQNNQAYISELEQQLNEAQMKCEHLSACNSELNTQRCEMEMRCMEMSERCKRMERELADMESLREAKIELGACKKRLSKVESELGEQRELVEQLNQAKEFLVENNSKLLTNVIKIQLFVESIGLDQTEIESLTKVKDYEEAIERQLAHRFGYELSMSTAVMSQAYLKAQLKYCYEECEKVVLKLSQLKQHNESFNNKIKTIKSSMVVT